MTYGRTLAEIIDEHEAQLNEGSSFFCSDALHTTKANKKLKNALNSFASSASGDVLLLIDFTLLGSNSDGLVLTESDLFYKKAYEDAERIKVENLVHAEVDTDDRELVLRTTTGREYVGYTHSELNRRMNIFANCLNAYFEEKKSV